MNNQSGTDRPYNKPKYPIITDLNTMRLSGPAKDMKLTKKRNGKVTGSYLYYLNGLRKYEKLTFNIVDNVVIYCVTGKTHQANYINGILDSFEYSSTQIYRWDHVSNQLLLNYQLRLNPIRQLKSKTIFHSKLITLGAKYSSTRSSLPSSLTLYDGTTTHTVDLSSLENADELQKVACQFLFNFMRSKYTGYRIYVLDYRLLQFLLNVCLGNEHLSYSVMSKDNRLIEIKIKNLKDSVHLYIRDAVNLLSLPLEQLSSIFQKPLSNSVEDQLKSLYDILYEYSLLVYKLWGVNPLDYRSFSGLSLAIYRTKYLKDEYELYSIDGLEYDVMRPAFKGGAVDVYIPHGKNLYYYDINSMYPHTMCKDMPVGSPIYKDYPMGTTSTEDFGIMYVRVTAPENLDKPFLLQSIPVGQKSKRVLAPLGVWTGHYFSEELKYAEKLGYKIEYIYGYTFDRGRPFNEFIDTMYNIRKELNLSNVAGQLGVTVDIIEDNISKLKFLAKLLMNSLYGRLAMSPDNSITKVLTQDEIINQGKNIEPEIEPLSKGYYLVNTQEGRNKWSSIPVSVAIASAITAYARMLIYEYKNIPGNPCYYSDTDSVFLQYPLPQSVMGEQLGMMKLEAEIQEAVFLAPKAYGYIDNNNNEVVKIKGTAQNTTLNDLRDLLVENKSTVLLSSRKMLNRERGIYETEDTNYTLRVSQSKRHILYHNGKFVGTQPLVINGSKVIKNRITTPLLGAPRSE